MFRYRPVVEGALRSPTRVMRAAARGYGAVRDAVGRSAAMSPILRTEACRNIKACLRQEGICP